MLKYDTLCPNEALHLSLRNKFMNRLEIVTWKTKQDLNHKLGTN